MDRIINYLQKNKHVFSYSIICCAVLAIHLSGSFWIGFISDDYGLINAAAKTPIFRPLEGHHFSPFINILFKITAKFKVHPLCINSISLFFHLLNCFLVYCISYSFFRHKGISTFAITLLFGINPAGFEAIVWNSAIGYLTVSFPILLSILLLVKQRPKSSYIHVIILPILQFIALLLWDWGILLAPILFIISIAYLKEINRWTYLDIIKLLLPTFAALFFLLFIKFISGYSAGYYKFPNNIFDATKLYISSILFGLIPNSTTPFLKSIPVLLAFFVVYFFMIIFALRDSKIRLLFFLFYFWHIPVFLFGYPQSRYFYLSSFFLYGLLILIIAKIRTPLIRNGCMAVIIILCLFFSFQRSRLWLGAYKVAQEIKEEVENIDIPDQKKLVIANMPTRYGPDNMIWRPFIWQNGLSSFKKSFLLVNLPGCQFTTWKSSPIETIGRNEVKEKYPHNIIYEFVYDNDWRKFKMTKFK